MAEIINVEEVLSSSYAPSVHEAVRYGYQYRKISEGLDDRLQFSLGAVPEVLLWLASAVASGIAYDLIKKSCKQILLYLKSVKHKLNEETENILKDDTSLKEFVVYVEEYYSQSMTITESQEKYIKEEVIADTMAKEAYKVYKETNNFVLSIEEYKKITKIAMTKADELIKRK